MTTYNIELSAILNAFRADARVATNAIPYILHAQGYGMVPTKGGGWFVTQGEHTLKPRALTEEGINFSPSSAKGMGRSATSVNWEQGLAGITGFLVFDSTSFEQGLRTWQVSVRQVRAWKQEGIVSGTGVMTRADWFERVAQVG